MSGSAHDFLPVIARIRALELKILDLFGQGKLFGTTHTCIGQELCAAALYANIDPTRDAVFSNHRCHGHFLAYGGPMDGLLAEIMGREGGVCRGRGGSQHLCVGRFFSNGVQGGGMPLATGYAWHQKRAGKGGIVVAHIGDGTLGEGVIYESMNLAALLAVPLLVVLEHNGYAQSTATSRTTAGDVEKRFAAFGIECDRRAADDPVALSEHLRGVVERVRGNRPFVQILDTFRLMAHSKGDDDRPAELLRKGWDNDYFQRLLNQHDPLALEAKKHADAEIAAVTEIVDARPPAPLGTVEAFAPSQSPWPQSTEQWLAKPSADGSNLRINERLNRGLHTLFKAHNDLVLIGEDLADPYGGAFKVTRGLTTQYPDRVLSSPISEAAITGVASGFAIAGGRAVVEIMFGDFATLAADQIINQAAKMYFMYAEQVQASVVIRLVSGGYRGYGPTHSQSIERIFCGIPGLKVVALSRRHAPDELIGTVVGRDNNPVLFVENKLLYAQRPVTAPPLGLEFQPGPAPQSGTYPPLAFKAPGGQPRATVVTYGGMTEWVEAAMEKLVLEREMDVDYFILTQLYPLQLDEILRSVEQTRRLLVVEEGTRSFGVGAEIAAALSERSAHPLAIRRIAAREVPIPASRDLELGVLPNAQDISAALMELCEREWPA